VESFDGKVLMMQSAPTGTVDRSDDQAAIDRDLAAGQVAALDPRTGVELWHRGGALLSMFGSHSLILLVHDAADAAPDAGWRIVTVDQGDGHDLWSVPAPIGTQWTFTYDDDLTPVDGLVLVDDDGNVISIDGSGQQTPRGRIQPGAKVEWAWSSYLGVSRPTAGLAHTDGPPLRRFELHDLRTLGPAPVWNLAVNAVYGSPWPCGAADRLCLMNNDVFTELDVRTGTQLGQHEDQPPDLIHSPPAAIGMWTMVGTWDAEEDWLVHIPPALSKTGVGWLGVARLDGTTPRITALMPLPIQTTSCWTGDGRWVICSGFDADGQFADHSIAIRRSEVDDLITLLRGTR
jgi:hypothetical protein